MGSSLNKRSAVPHCRIQLFISSAPFLFGLACLLCILLQSQRLLPSHLCDSLGVNGAYQRLTPVLSLCVAEGKKLNERTDSSTSLCPLSFYLRSKSVRRTHGCYRSQSVLPHGTGGACGGH